MTNINTGLAVCRLIGDLINNKNTFNQPLPSVANMANFAERHSLLTMLYPALKRCNCSAEEISALAKKADTIGFYQIKVDAFAKRLSKTFSENHIPHMILKGVEYHKYYPSELIRQTSDIDYYMPQEYSEMAQDIILSLGFKQKCEFDNSLNFEKQPCYHIELHTKFNPKGENQRQVLSELLDNCENVDEYRKRLTNTSNLVYALMHLYKHISKCGAGVKMLLDIYMIQKNADINQAELDRMIKQLNFEKFYSAVSRISKYLFEGTEIDSDLKNAVNFILNCSTFGDETIYHQISVSKESGNQRLNAIKHLSKELGFSAENIKRKYPLARKHPVTIPYFQVHRVVNGLLHKKSSVNEAALRYKAVKDNESITQIKLIMDTMGVKQE